MLHTLMGGLMDYILKSTIVS